MVRQPPGNERSVVGANGYKGKGFFGESLDLEPLSKRGLTVGEYSAGTSGRFLRADYVFPQKTPFVHRKTLPNPPVFYHTLQDVICRFL